MMSKANAKKSSSTGGKAPTAKGKNPKQLAQQPEAAMKTNPKAGLSGPSLRSAQASFRWVGSMLGIEREKIDALLVT